MDYGSPILPHIECPQEKAEKLSKEYNRIQNKIDTDKSYRESIIKAREDSVRRVSESGLISASDDFLSNTYYMTLSKKNRDAVFEKTKDLDMVSFLNYIHGSDRQ